MHKAPRQPAANAVNGEAINRVLQAEHDAQQAVEQCENQAREILQAAQLQAQYLSQRAGERITRVEMRCAQWLSEQGRLLAREESRQDAEQVIDSPADDNAAVVEALAARLTGAGGEEA